MFLTHPVHASRKSIPLAIACFVSVLAATVVCASPENSFIIRDVSVFTGESVIPRTTVLVRDGRVAIIGAMRTTVPHLTVIDGRGKMLLPGLIDSHVHVFHGAQQDALRFGVTTELDMFNVGGDLKLWKAQRNSLSKTDAADTWSSGLGVTAPGGHPSEFSPPGSMPVLALDADAKAFVDARVKEGSDYIKLLIEDLSEYPGLKAMPTLSRAQVCAVIMAAHQDARQAIVHVQTIAAASTAIDCGADGLAHTFPDKPADQAFAAQMQGHHVFLLSTVGIWNWSSGLGMAQMLAADPRVAPYLSATQKENLLTPLKSPSPNFYANALATLGVLHRSGVTILAGTDSPNPGSGHGVALHQELQILVAAGFTPIEALQAATSLPAKIFNLGNRGRIALGARADLVLVDGDPTAQISDTLNITRIWKNGYSIERAPPAH